MKKANLKKKVVNLMVLVRGERLKILYIVLSLQRSLKIFRYLIRNLEVGDSGTMGVGSLIQANELTQLNVHVKFSSQRKCNVTLR